MFINPVFLSLVLIIPYIKLVLKFSSSQQYCEISPQDLLFQNVLGLYPLETGVKLNALKRL